MELLTPYLLLLLPLTFAEPPKIDYHHFAENFLEDHLRNYNSAWQNYLEPRAGSSFYKPALHNETCMSNVEQTYSMAVGVEFYWGRDLDELQALHQTRFQGDITKIVQPDREIIFTNTVIPCDIRLGLVCVPRDPRRVRGAGDCKLCASLHPEELQFTRGGTHDPKTLQDSCDLAAKVLPKKVKATTVKPSGAESSQIWRRSLLLPALLLVAFSVRFGV